MSHIPLAAVSSIPETAWVKRYYVYFAASRPGGALYVGVTNDLVRRIHEHKSGSIDGFTKRYGIDQLVYFEIYDSIHQAIQREKNIKHWSRAWKTRLIGKINPSWRDLYDEIAS
jgi:putative endonuclease